VLTTPPGLPTFPMWHGFLAAGLKYTLQQKPQLFITY
jgi:hypothetical protein